MLVGFFIFVFLSLRHLGSEIIGAGGLGAITRLGDLCRKAGSLLSLMGLQCAYPGPGVEQLP